MNIEEFQKEIEKDYNFDKYWNYFFSMSFLVGGVLILYKSTLTNWGNQLSAGLYVWTLLFSIVLIYYGTIGFINTQKLTEVYRLPNNGVDEGKSRIEAAAKKLKIQLFLSEENPNLIKGATNGYLIQGKDILFLVNENNIYINIQQRNYNGPTYLSLSSSKKLFQKIKRELAD